MDEPAGAANREEAPLACTLDGGGFRERMAWIADLNARALKAARRSGLRLELEYDASALGDVRKMMAQERVCCGFLSFDLEARGDSVVLVVTAPARAADAADALLEGFAARSPGPA